MKTVEQIALSFGLCTCDEAFTKRNLVAPDCPWHSLTVEEAMEEYGCQLQSRITELEEVVNLQSQANVEIMGINLRYKEALKDISEITVIQSNHKEAFEIAQNIISHILNGTER